MGIKMLIVQRGKGILRKAPPRSAAERLNSRAEATVVLATLIPDLAGARTPKENQDDLVKNRKNEMGIEMLIVQRGKDAAGSPSSMRSWFILPLYKHCIFSITSIST
jgi:hypothetical protein